MSRVVEICVADPASARAAWEGGADRIELCADLASGGTTPSFGLLTKVIGESPGPVHVLIRPRGGDFVVDRDEFIMMALDIDIARGLGAVGVVLGALRPDATIDAETIARLVDHARPLSITFHKAIDLVPDPPGAIDTLAALGIDRVLTSGGLGAARGNVATLRAMAARADGRLAVMVGGGLAESDLAGLLDATGLAEVHLGSGVTGPPSPPGPFGMRPAPVESERVRRVVRLVKNP
jgi:copper homeostasis protein